MHISGCIHKGRCLHGTRVQWGPPSSLQRWLETLNIRLPFKEKTPKQFYLLLASVIIIFCGFTSWADEEDEAPGNRAAPAALALLPDGQTIALLVKTRLVRSNIFLINITNIYKLVIIIILLKKQTSCAALMPEANGLTHFSCPAHPLLSRSSLPP